MSFLLCAFKYKEISFKSLSNSSFGLNLQNLKRLSILNLFIEHEEQVDLSISLLFFSSDSISINDCILFFN